MKTDFVCPSRHLSRKLIKMKGLMRLTERKLRKIVREELNEVFSSDQERKIINKLTALIEERGCKIEVPAYSRGLFEVGPSGFKVKVMEIKDGVNRSEVGMITKFPALQSERGIETRTIWAPTLTDLADKFVNYYKDFYNEYDVNDEGYEDWIDVQIQRSQGTLQKSMDAEAF